MSRAFAPAQNEYLQLSSSPLTPYPLVMGCWFKTNNAGLTQNLMNLGASTSAHNFSLHISSFNGTARCHSEGGIISEAQTSNTWSANTWQLAIGVWANVSSRIIYLNGSASSGNSGASVTVSGVNRFRIAQEADSSTGSRSTFSGSIAEAFIANVVPTTTQINQLWNGGSGGAGLSPDQVFGVNLISWWKLLASDGSIDYDGTNHLLEINTPTNGADHPNIDYGSSGSSIPRFRHHYRNQGFMRHSQSGLWLPPGVEDQLLRFNHRGES